MRMISASQGRPASVVSVPSRILFKLKTIFSHGALWSILSFVLSRTTFWNWSRLHCWFPSTVVWARQSSGRANLRRESLWRRQMPVKSATWSTGAHQSLLPPISKWTLRVSIVAFNIRLGLGSQHGEFEFVVKVPGGCSRHHVQEDYLVLPDT